MSTVSAKAFRVHLSCQASLALLMAAVPVQAATTLWMHNGSIVELEHQGDLRRFYYYEPRGALARAGVGPGTVLFNGRSTGNRYIGTAYFFNPRCGRGSYEVKGPILDNQTRVVLEGRAPRIGDDCRVHAYFTDRLEFKYLQEANVPAANVPAEPLPTQTGQSSVGTGFFVATSRVLTNYHVVGGCTVLNLTVPGVPSSTGRVVASDPKNDLALVALTDNTLSPHASPSFRTRVRLGEAAFAFGYPLPGLLSSSGNFTSGSISSLAGLGDDVNKIQMSTPVQPGNSGGPLLDIYGNVIGVVAGKLNAGKVSQVIDDIPQNVNFAIKASVAINFLEANDVPTSLPVSNATELPTTDVAERAKQFSVQVICKP